MSLDKDTVAKIAHLARIRVEEDKLDPLAAELNNIIGWVEQLGEVETDGVPPMTSVVHVTLPRRTDKVDDGGDPDRVFGNAPTKVNHFYAVPKVVE